MHKNKSYTYLGIGGNGRQVHAPCDGPKFVHLSVYTACDVMATAQHTTHTHTASMIPEVIITTSTTTTSVSSLCMLFLDIDQSRDDSGNMMLTTMD